jgi:2-hydroxy-3-oxopropionate reductase
MPGAAVASQLFNAMVGSGMGEEDNMAVIKLIEQLAGVKE